MLSIEQLSKVREVLSKRKGSRVRGQGLAESIAKKLSIPVMDAREALDKLRDNDELEANDWHPQLGPQGMVSLKLNIPTIPTEISWGNAMKIAGIGADDMRRLMPAASVLSDMPVKDLIAVANGLIQLRMNQETHYGESRYLISAKYLIGSSKMLDALPSSALKAYGIDLANFSVAPSYIMTAGPPEPRAVVLVENPQAFELAVKANLTDVAWVTTYGYGLSRSGDSNGSQLAAIIESGQMIAVVRKGNPPPLDILIKHPLLTFWGDLDPAGLHIFHRLQMQLPQLRLSALYQPMVERLHDNGGHPYTKATGKEGQMPQFVSDPIAQTLLSTCSFRGIDQEFVELEYFTSDIGLLSV